jgi:hypothetical protein
MHADGSYVTVSSEGCRDLKSKRLGRPRRLLTTGATPDNSHEIALAQWADDGGNSSSNTQGAP